MKHVFNMQSDRDGRPGRRESRRCGLDRLASAARWLLCVSLAVVWVLTGAGLAKAADDAPMDFQVKAAFLLNFPKYVDWPNNAFTRTNSPLVVAVYGDPNIADAFESMIAAGKTVDGHPIRLKRISNEDQIGTDCHVLFIAQSARQRLAPILGRLHGAAILCVGESDDFLERGGVINLVQRDRKIRFQVNLDAADRAHLKISSRLLVVADAVQRK